jgi:hypothetical protein
MKVEHRRRIGWWLLAAVAAAAAGCGADETIRVNLLPPGNARGSSATGLYHWSEKIVSTDCPATLTVEGRSVSLPQASEVYEACGDVIQDEGYFAFDFLNFWGGTTGVARPAFLADGGLWQMGQFRIGGVFALSSGVPARALLDGQYNPPGSSPVVQSFEGIGLVQVFQGEGAAERLVCSYETRFTGDRNYDCEVP